MPSYRLKVSAVLAAAMLMAGCGNSSSANPEQFYSTAQATRGDMASVVQTYGRITAQQEETLRYTTVNGTISEVLVQVGQTVKSGDELVKLDIAGFERDLVEAQADLLVAEAKLREAEVTASESAVLEAQANLIAAENAVSKTYLEWQIAAEIGLEELENAVITAQAQVLAAEQQLEMTALTAQSSRIRQLEYDEAFLQRKLRDLAADDDPVAVQEQLDVTQQDLAAARSSRESAIQGAQDAVSQAERDLQRAQAKLERAQSGVESPTAAAELAYQQALSRRDEAQTELDRLSQGNDPAAVEAAKTTYDAAVAKVEEIEKYIADATLCAPFDGIVFSVQVQAGQYISSSDDIIYLADPGQLGASADVMEVDVTRMEPGQQVRITFDAFPDQFVTGELTSIDQQASMQSGIPTFQMHVSINDAPAGVTPGMSANLRIVVGEHQDVLMVPAAAITQDYEGIHIQVQKGSGQWETRTISTGANDGIMVQVIDGLEEGETVMLPLTDASSDQIWAEPVLEQSAAEDDKPLESDADEATEPEIDTQDAVTDTVPLEIENTEAK